MPHPLRCGGHKSGRGAGSGRREARTWATAPAADERFGYFLRGVFTDFDAPGAAPFGGGFNEDAGFEEDPYPPRFSPDSAPRRADDLSAMAAPRLRVDELKVLHLVPANEQSAVPEIWRPFVVQKELTSLAVDRD